MLGEGMEMLTLDPMTWAVAVMVAIVAGLVKGLVGFALPMVFISGLSLVLPPHLALAALIMPTFFTNGWQALRQGPAAALGSVKRFRIFLISGAICLAVSAQFVLYLAPATLFFLIGFLVTAFTLWQLVQVDVLQTEKSVMKDVLVGGCAGVLGGLSGIWGPPTVLYLTAIATEKSEQIRVQGVVYGLGAVALIVAHVGSGVLYAQSFVLSLVLVIPAVFGLWLGSRLQDLINQRGFRRLTLLILMVAGLNLLRRSLI
jgi:uncharacterized membrane protein YfcA